MFPKIYYFLAFIIGICIGSFLNVVIYRFPTNLSIVKPRSFCPNCNKKLTWRENIPLISWIIQRGMCLSCNKKISIRYPFVELLTGFLLTITAIHFNFGIEALMAAILTAILIVVSMIDKDTQIIPDSIVIPLLWMGLSISLIHPLTNTSKLFISPSDAIIGAFDICNVCLIDSFEGCDISIIIPNSFILIIAFSPNLLKPAIIS